MGEPFRDEHTALLQRVARLEEDLDAARGGDAKHDGLAKELDELTKRVAVALERADADRTALADVSQALERIRRTVAPADAPKPEAPSAPPGPKEQQRARLGWLLIVGAVGVLAVLGLVLVGRPVSSPALDETPKTLDPSAVLDEARKQAIATGLPATGELVRINARYASSDGLVHLREPTYEASLEFVFAAPPAEAPKASSSAPLGVPPPGMFESQKQIRVLFDRTGVHATDASTFMHDPTVPNPHCTVAAVWKAALAQGAPGTAVATINYENDLVARNLRLQRTPHWTFEIAQTSFKYDISDADCTVIR
jgi:hypothetical protein